MSHVIPSFVAAWLKETSRTGFLRGVTNPNLRRQDLAAKPLLCSSCEVLLSQSEGWFAENIFYPFHQRGRHWNVFEYDESLLRFAVSLAWRVVIAYPNADLPQGATAAVNRVAEGWRRFLNKEVDNPGTPEHHIFFLDLVESATGPTPPGLNVYLLRSTDAGTFVVDDGLVVYVKLPGIAFFASISPPVAEGWKGTKISTRGELRSPQEMQNASIGELIANRAHHGTRLMNRMSPRQRRKIGESIERDPDRVATSGSFEAAEADIRLGQVLPNDE